MIIIKNKVAIEKMRKCGKLLAQILKDIEKNVIVGVSTLQLDSLIEKKIKNVGMKAECKGYAGYPFATCISLNNIVVHGMPSEKIILKSGDFVKIDVVTSYKGYCADMCRYFFVGQVSDDVKKIAYTAQRALDSAIDMVKPGCRLSDVSVKIQSIVEKAGFGVVREFAGHGIGKDIHEDPDVPNFGEPGKGPILRENMTLAIEPMITQGDYEIKIDKDGWTVRTVDGGLAGHVEDTILITKRGAEILTRLP